METPLELEDIAGLSLTIIGTLIESYIKEGYADPIMFKALKAASGLAEHYKERLVLEDAPTDFIEQVGELLVNLQVTAMECGEVVEQIIRENGWQDQAEGWSELNHNHEDGTHE